MTSALMVNAANLHKGGAVQVAASFIEECAHIIKSEAIEHYPWLEQSHFQASTSVLDNVSQNVKETLEVFERNDRPQTIRWTPSTPKHKVRFDIFGPTYDCQNSRLRVAGFADVTSIYGDPTASKSFPASTLKKIRRSYSRHYFSNSDAIIVEAPHVKNQLVNQWRLPPDSIAIAPNCVNSLFKPLPPQRNRRGWLYVARNYPHKNIDILGKVGEILEENKFPQEFILTLSESEWRKLSSATRRYSANVGPLNITELPALYASVEGCIFPSLLECFSATPLEAMATQTPLIASDRSFVRDICGDAAQYVDPQNAHQIADAIMDISSHPRRYDGMVRLGLQRSQEWPTARQRAVTYLNVLNRMICA